ncbi:hypothetical protein F4558_001734 [Micromonospora profundi]|uniref:hypothetical protein n=1 Tax=Micromonospora profundi TaxID=1420889 RepID=UPI00143A9A1C|nr:hypothetical protein [Micromonospora profundi]NJC11908.1 hypothetical protein [Micromonospora profundi]
MTSKARESFLTGIEALRTSIDTPLVSGGDTVGSFLRRGLTIVAYNLLEAFMVERLEETATHVNAGIGHFSDLPERLKKAATQDLLKVANAQLQWSTDDLSSLVSYTRELGECLAASSGALRLSPLMWQWSGSNMSADDYHKTLRLFHVKDPWDTIKHLAGRIGVSMPDARATMVALSRERNNCAHRSSYSVSNLFIRAIPNQILTLGLGADMSVSVAAHQIRQADPQFHNDEKWFHPGRITFRFVQQRSGTWAEVVEGRTRAVRLTSDQNAAIRAALGAAYGKSQLVVVQDGARRILDWAYPEFS